MTLKFADLVSAMSPRAGRSPGLGGPRRTDHLAKSTSAKATATMPGAQGRKVDGSGNKPQADGSRWAHLRFAHFAEACSAAERGAGTAAASVGDTVYRNMSFDHIPGAHGVRQSAIRQAIAYGSKTEAQIAAEERKAEAAAQFIMKSAAKARGGRV